MKRIILFLISVVLFLPQFTLADSSLNSAIDWIKQNQNETGLIGNNEFEMPPALIALWLYEGNSDNVIKGFEYLNEVRADDGSWFYSSTDVTGLIFYAFSSTNHTSLLNDSGTNTIDWLLSQQGADGGFASWGEESSENTAYALLGLLNVNGIPDKNKSAAVNYILSLQNPDGSINRTGTDMIGYAGLGPEYYTAISLITLNEAGIYNENTTNALNYLKEKSKGYFRDQNHSFLAALASVAFSRYNKIEFALNTTNYLKSLQMGDGGFVDSSRFNPNVSNVLDTGWAAIALHEVISTIRVGILTTFPNGTTFGHCLTLNENSTAEDALKATDMETLWLSFSGYGDALTKIEYVGCPVSNPWCQCSDLSVCCLIWNFWIWNATNNSWQFSSVGYSDYRLNSEDIIGNVWTSDAGKAPPSYSFYEICPDGFITTNVSFVDAYTCHSCTSDQQCVSGDCCNGICQEASKTCCGEDGCESGETCSSCSQDCGSCLTTPSGGGGTAATVTTSSTTTSSTTTTTTTSPTTTTPAITTTALTTTIQQISQVSPLTGLVTFVTSPLGIGVIIVGIVILVIIGRFLILHQR